MKVRSFPQMLLLTCCTMAMAPAMLAQNSILLFKPSLVEPTVTGTNASNPYIFQTSIQQLSCPSTIQAKLSSTTDGTGWVLVSDTIQMDVQNPGDHTYNDCSTDPLAVCFNPITFGIPAALGAYTGQNPDTYVPGVLNPNHYTLARYGGVAPIDIHGKLHSGNQQVTFSLKNVVGYTANSTLYLDTNCSPTGVSGPSTIINNVPPGTGGSTETFIFNNTPDNGVSFDYTLPPGVDVPAGLVEHVSDSAIDPATFQQNYEYGTSFSTASCFLHAGEILPSGNPACKMYTLLCSVGTDPTESGALCPASAAATEIFGEVFDPPLSFTLTLPDITSAAGTFHTGVGLLMGPDVWPTGISCAFTPGSIPANNNMLCPQNQLFDFSGPGASSSQGRGSNVNSTFITVYGVPEDLTTVTVTNSGGTAVPVGPGNWINNTAPYVKLSSMPPSLAGISDATLPGAAEFVAAPIQTISFGLTAPGGTVPTPANEPIGTDTVVTNGTSCPTAGYAGAPAATTLTSPVEPLSLSSGDGSYLMHYYAQDCAGTQELLFTKDPSTLSWSTSFYTYALNLDTGKPTASITSPSTGGTYTVGQSVAVNYNCSDSLSGLVKCGSKTYSVSGSGPGPQTGLASSGNITTDTLPTGTPGPQTFTVTAQDAAGNTNTASISYTVSGKASQTISFTAPTQEAYTGTPYLISPALSATATSSLPVTFSIVSGPGQIVGNNLKITGLGTVKVAADQAGNGSYSAAPTVTQSVNVTAYLAPAVTGESASPASSSTETLSATIYPNNTATTWYFMWGTSAASLTHATTPATIPAGTSGVPVSATIGPLTPGTYYYRLMARSLGGTTYVPLTTSSPATFTVGP